MRSAVSKALRQISGSAGMNSGDIAGHRLILAHQMNFTDVD